MVRFNQTGYVGYSMSKRAALAYMQGEKPLSRWTKGDILGELQGYYTEEEYNTFSSLPLWFLKEHFLLWSSWHHTGKYARATDFYKICEYRDIEDTLKWFQECKAARKAARKR